MKMILFIILIVLLVYSFKDIETAIAYIKELIGNIL